jgi:hypothetical protein
VIPLLLVGHVELIFVPRVLSLAIRSNLRMGILTWVSCLLNKAWKDLVTRWLLCLVIPLFLIRHIKLILIPRVLSLAVWGDFRMRILAWIGVLLNKAWEDLVTRWVLSLMIPSLLVGLIMLILVPCVLSLEVRENFGMRVFAWISRI